MKIAYVDSSEIAAIEGFDEDTASEIQTRAREHLEKEEAAREAKRKELGVEDALVTVPGVTSVMLVAFGEKGIKTVEDLADCATDDLVGWHEKKDGENKRHAGVLDGLEFSRKDAEMLIMQARVAAGWITAEDLAQMNAPPEELAAEDAEPAEGEGEGAAAGHPA